MMTAVEQLQQVGLNKYEAEAYYTLLAEGPLTGYELGKRSQVPLSRSYEILERLTQKGLALVQPGDPPRYSAEDPGRFLGQVRQAMTKTLDTLAVSLAALTGSRSEDEFWVLRGQQHVLARARAMVRGAQRTVSLYLSPAYAAELADDLVLAREKGCRILRASTVVQDHTEADMILLLVDEREILAGTLMPADRCQCVVSENRALVTALSSYFVRLPYNTAPVSSPATAPQSDRLDWVAWEDRKQRRLWSLNIDNRVA
jgi:HTH-type transcriptional regulator, sugar sensing transcriptional regulator